MANNITKSVFIQDPEKYNYVDGIEKDNKNEALTITKEGEFIKRETDPKFNQDTAIMIDKRNILKFRGNEKLDLEKKAEPGFTTQNSEFVLNGGNKKDKKTGEVKPNFVIDKSTDPNKSNKIYQVGTIKVNALRSLNNENQSV